MGIKLNKKGCEAWSEMKSTLCSEKKNDDEDLSSFLYY